MTDFGKIHDYIQSKREEIVNELCALVRIPSVSGTKEENLVLDYTKALEITVKMLIECDKIKE